VGDRSSHIAMVTDFWRKLTYSPFRALAFYNGWMGGSQNEWTC